jgi:AhpD family alkylhydroperoxidase
VAAAAQFRALKARSCLLNNGSATQTHQINGCAYCLDQHTRVLQKKSAKAKKLALAQVWRKAVVLFDERERAALAWAEIVTRVAETAIPEVDYQSARAAFSEKELVDLTIAIGLMNTYNRMAIGFRKQPQAVLAHSAEC